MYLLFCHCFLQHNFCSKFNFRYRYEKQSPIFGANVKIVGEATGTVTDIDGNFTLISSTNRPYVIEVTSIGFQRVSITSKIKS
jgi:hypothetical protein